MAMYSLSFSAVAATVAQDVFQIEASTIPIVIHRVTLSQSSDLGDAAAEGLNVKILRATDAMTDDGGEVSLDIGVGTFTGKCAINETTQLVTGASVIHAEGWNIAMPFIYLPTPEERPTVEVGNLIVVSMSVPADSITISGTIVFEER